MNVVFLVLFKCIIVWITRLASRIYQKIVLYLGSLHLTLMAVIGIWFWSSPGHFTSGQPEQIIPDTLHCTSMVLLGQPIGFSSSPLQTVSVVLYAVFVLPCLNLLLPAAFFLALHIIYHRLQVYYQDITKQSPAAKLRVVPAVLGLSFLLAINVVFLVSIETTISYHDVTEEHDWTFGQTLAVILLALPLRDVLDFVTHVRHEKRRERYSKDLIYALDHGGMDEVKKAVQYADIRVEASGMSPRIFLQQGKADLNAQVPFQQLFSLPHMRVIWTSFVFWCVRKLISTLKVTQLL
jgi:hypothetical protein